MNITCQETCRNLPAGMHSTACPDHCPACGIMVNEDEITECPFCGGTKCTLCDMGNDVTCLNCENVMQLQVNTKGTWRNVLDFAKTEETNVREAACLLAKAGRVRANSLAAEMTNMAAYEPVQ
jgi:hypothetical protein